MAAIKKRELDAVVTDLRMDVVDGFDVLAASLTVDPLRPVIIMTAYGSIDGAMEAVRLGAAHYLTKPFKLEEVALYLDRSLSEQTVRRENERLRKVLDERLGFHKLVGKSAVMRQLYDLLERVSTTTAPVLVMGESGTGKELVARALHHGGSRASGPFVAINCAALTDSLLESELFGHARGAFTGANEARKGLFVEADGGTLFLDEMGEIPLGLQAKPAACPRDLGGPTRGWWRRAQGRRADHRSDEPGSGASGPGEAVPRGPVLPSARHPGASAALACAP